MSAGQHIDYDGLVRAAVLEAKRSVVRSVMAQVAKTGLVGGHHFLIAFNTQGEGVVLSKRLREKYPVEMTIVLQHRFWDLEVSHDHFEVKLTFDSIPERLSIPYTAIKAFYDPSVPYMMPFDELEMGSDGAAVEARRSRGRNSDEAETDDAADGRPSRDDAKERGERRPRSTRRTRVAEPADGTGEHGGPTQATPSQDGAAVAEGGTAAPTPPVPAQPVPRARPAVAEAAGDTKPEEAPAKTDAGGGAKVLDLSAFRGKKK